MTRSRKSLEEGVPAREPAGTGSHKADVPEKPKPLQWRGHRYIKMGNLSRMDSFSITEIRPKQGKFLRRHLSN
jgi:hypothetical protein